jgi:hypothetical protein
VGFGNMETLDRVGAQSYAEDYYGHNGPLHCWFFWGN